MRRGETPARRSPGGAVVSTQPERSPPSEALRAKLSEVTPFEVTPFEVTPFEVTPFEVTPFAVRPTA
jgi:hypothetical protein